MSAARRLRPATYADIEALPENVVGEILAGELYTSPRPAIPHTVAGSLIGGDLMGPFHRGRGGPGGWIILDEPELHLAEDVLVPDLAGWRRERLPRAPSTPNIALSPDWVCEIQSPSTARLDRAIKMPRYARYGVNHLWMVDPIARFLEVYRLDGGSWKQVGVWSGDEPARIEPFDAIELDISGWWEEAPPVEG
jgi:Uma2 family endonuclease